MQRKLQILPLLLLFLAGISFAGLYTSTYSNNRSFNLTNMNNHSANVSYFHIDNLTFNSSTGGALQGGWRANDCMDFIITTSRNDSIERDVNFTLKNMTGLTACDYTPATGNVNITGYINTSKGTAGYEPGVTWNFTIYYNKTTTPTTWPATNSMQNTFIVGDNWTTTASANTAYWTAGTFNGAATSESINGTSEQIFENGPTGGGWRGIWYQSVIGLGDQTVSAYNTIKANISVWTETEYAEDYQALVGFVNTTGNTGLGFGTLKSNGNNTSQVDMKTCCQINFIVGPVNSFLKGSTYVLTYNRSQNGLSETWSNASSINSTVLSGTIGLYSSNGSNVGFAFKEDTNNNIQHWMKIAWIAAYNNLDAVTLAPNSPSTANTTSVVSTGTNIATAYRNTTLPLFTQVSTTSGNVTEIDASIYYGGVNQTVMWTNFTNGSAGFYNSTNISTFNLTSANNTYKGLQIIQGIIARAANGANSSEVNSSTITINDSVPFADVQPTWTNVSWTQVTANCTAIDGDGGTDIAGVNISTNATSATALQNGTNGIRFWQTYNLTTASNTTYNFVCGFTDKNGTYSSNSQNNTNTTQTVLPPSYGPEVQLQTGQYNASVNWSETVTISNTAGSQACAYTIAAQQVKNTTISDKDGNQVTNTGTTAAPAWTCFGANAPYTVSFTTEALLTKSATSASTTLGAIAERDNLTVNGSTAISMNARHVFVDVQGVTNTVAWVCYANISANSACSDTTIGNWTSHSVTPDGSGVVNLALTSYGNLSIEWTHSNPSPGGGGGSGGGGGAPPAPSTPSAPSAPAAPTGTPPQLQQTSDFIAGIQTWLKIPPNAFITEIGLWLFILFLSFFAFGRGKTDQALRLFSGAIIIVILVISTSILYWDWSFVWTLP